MDEEKQHGRTKDETRSLSLVSVRVRPCSSGGRGPGYHSAVTTIEKAPSPPALPAGARSPALSVDLAALGLLAPLPTAFLAGRDLDLLDPLRFLAPGTLPHIPSYAAPPG